MAWAELERGGRGVTWWLPKSFPRKMWCRLLATEASHRVVQKDEGVVGRVPAGGGGVGGGEGVGGGVVGGGGVGDSGGAGRGAGRDDVSQN